MKTPKEKKRPRHQVWDGTKVSVVSEAEYAAWSEPYPAGSAPKLSLFHTHWRELSASA